MTSGVSFIASQQGIDGCPTFAQGYVGRKRWAKPNDRSRCVDFPGGRCNNAIKFHRKSREAKWRDLQCAPRPSRILRLKPQPPNRSVIPPVPACRGTEAKRSGGICSSADHSWKCLRQTVVEKSRATVGTQPRTPPVLTRTPGASWNLQSNEHVPCSIDCKNRSASPYV